MKHLRNLAIILFCYTLTTGGREYFCSVCVAHILGRGAGQTVTLT